MWWGAPPIRGFVLMNVMLRYVRCAEKRINIGGCGIWLSNIIAKEVIDVDELDEDNTSPAAGK